MKYFLYLGKSNICGTDADNIKAQLLSLEGFKAHRFTETYSLYFGVKKPAALSWTHLNPPKGYKIEAFIEPAPNSIPRLVEVLKQEIPSEHAHLQGNIFFDLRGKPADENETTCVELSTNGLEKLDVSFPRSEFKLGGLTKRLITSFFEKFPENL